MRSPKSVGVAISLGVVLVAIATVVAQRSMPSATSTKAASDATARVVEATKALMATLDDAGRTKIQHAFTDNAQRLRWSNFAAFTRGGIRMGDLTTSQRTAVDNLLAAALSKDGYDKIMGIMHADSLHALNVGSPTARGTYFGEKEYYLAFVGTPSTTAPWMLMLGGHHLAINLTMAGGQASMAPSLPGVQPGRFTLEGRTVRPMGQEHDIAYALLRTLDDAQKRQAIIAAETKDLVLGPGQDGKRIQPEGLKASSMSASQQAMLVDLVKQWAGIMNEAYADTRMAEIRATLPDTYFAWSGPTAEGQPAYIGYRGRPSSSSPSPQDGDPEHIHSMYRNPTNDYGAKFAGH